MSSKLSMNAIPAFTKRDTALENNIMISLTFATSGFHDVRLKAEVSGVGKAVIGELREALLQEVSLLLGS